MSRFKNLTFQMIIDGKRELAEIEHHFSIMMSSAMMDCCIATSLAPQVVTMTLDFGKVKVTMKPCSKIELTNEILRPEVQNDDD